QIFGHDTFFVFNVVDEFIAKVFDKAAYRHGGCIGQRTDGATHHVEGHGIQQLEVFGAALPVFDTVYHPPQPARAFATWRALATAFFKIEVRQAQQGFDHAAGFVHDDDGT